MWKTFFSDFPCKLDIRWFGVGGWRKRCLTVRLGYGVRGGVC